MLFARANAIKNKKQQTVSIHAWGLVTEMSLQWEIRPLESDRPVCVSIKEPGVLLAIENKEVISKSVCSLISFVE